jgi:drug/metabolite transporter (DMT)-like permease
MKKDNLTPKMFFLIVLNDIVDSAAQLLMKKGLLVAGVGGIALNNLAESASKGASSGLMWAGIAIYALNFFIWIVVLQRVDLSIAMPVGSTCYIFVPVAAVLFLHEEVSLVRWIGVMCIVLGIHFVSQSKKAIPQEAGHG